MTPSTNTVRLTKKLKEQLQFIRRSCEAYDQGAEEEALRIATHLRVIFHQTNSSTSLITYLSFGHKRMLSSSRGDTDWKDYLSHEINLNSPNPIRMRAILGDKFHELSIEDWWERETVFVHAGTNHSRRKIVLSAANKDGGAHVDSELEEYYEFLCAGEYLIGITGNLEYNGPPPFPQGAKIYPTNAHFALIRQFAHETLASVDYFKWLE
jgi:hypothetical protein